MFGPSTFPKLARLCNTNLTTNGLVAVTLDWKSFDASIPAWLIRYAFEIVWSMSYWSDDQKRNAKWSKIDRTVFDYVVEYFINTKMMFKDGTVHQKNRGIPSGSLCTSFIGSLINLLVIQTLFRLQGLKPVKEFYLGDDGILYFKEKEFKKKFNMDLLVKHAKKYFNLTIHPDKISITKGQQNQKFLGYTFNGYKLIRPTQEWFEMSMYTEHKVHDIDTSSSRMFAYYILGGCNDVKFSEFFHFYFDYWDSH